MPALPEPRRPSRSPGPGELQAAGRWLQARIPESCAEAEPGGSRWVPRDSESDSPPPSSSKGRSEVPAACTQFRGGHPMTPAPRHSHPGPLFPRSLGVKSVLLHDPAKDPSPLLLGPGDVPSDLISANAAPLNGKQLGGAYSPDPLLFNPFQVASSYSQRLPHPVKCFITHPLPLVHNPLERKWRWEQRGREMAGRPASREFCGSRQHPTDPGTGSKLTLAGVGRTAPGGDLTGKQQLLGTLASERAAVRGWPAGRPAALATAHRPRLSTPWPGLSPGGQGQLWPRDGWSVYGDRGTLQKAGSLSALHLQNVSLFHQGRGAGSPAVHQALGGGGWRGEASLPPDPRGACLGCSGS